MYNLQLTSLRCLLVVTAANTQTTIVTGIKQCVTSPTVMMITVDLMLLLRVYLGEVLTAEELS